MKRFKIKYLPVIKLFILSVILSSGAVSAQDITVVDSDADGVTIVYSPVINFTAKKVNGIEQTGFEFEKATFISNPGEPVLPFRTIFTAIPENAAPSIRLIGSEQRVLHDITVINSPGPANSDSLFKSGIWLNEEIVSPLVEGFVRLQKVVSFRLFPVAYNPAGKQVRLTDKMFIRVDFNSAGPESSSSAVTLPDTKTENLYRNILSNYETGKEWRKVPDRRPLRKTSLLSSGIWYTIPVENEGVYKITYQQLETFSIDPGSIDPRTIKIYNNGGGMLPESLSDPRPAGLLENAVRVVGEDDGVFDPDDYILFYGRGTDSWGWNSINHEIRHTKNIYTTTNVYWFTFGGTEGKRMSSSQYTPDSPQVFTSALGFVFREDETVKMFQSGNDWYAAELTSAMSKEYSVGLPGYIPGSSGNFRSSIYTSTPYPYIHVSRHTLAVNVNNDEILTKSIFGSTPNTVVRTSAAFPESGEFILEFENRTAEDYSSLYLDWFEIEYQRDLTAREGLLRFQASGYYGPARFEINGFEDGQIDIYKISDFENISHFNFSFNQESGTAFFSDTLRSNREQFLAVHHDNYLSISSMAPAVNSFLKTESVQADYIIISPREFVNAALPLKQFHEDYNALVTRIVPLDEIYNEFGAGLSDPVAIRDFVKFAFENWVDQQNNPPRYLLLFGDGNYDYAGIRSDSEQNFIPPYQINSTNELVSRAVDDFYGWVSGYDYYVDLAIGRLPVKSVQMASDVVNKISQYHMNPEYGPWRNRITYVADDEITPYTTIEDDHTDQAEALATAGYVPEFLDQSKIYLMEYEAEPNIASSSDHKPQAQDDLVQQMNDGSRIITYVGHGSHRLLAHEWVLTREMDMPRIQNGRRQFFFYIASCAFGRWDFRNEDSMAEMLLNESEAGAIGIISAARDVFATPNYSLANQFFKHLFTPGRTTSTIGEALQAGKINIYSDNSEKYFLLGDPAMRFEFPRETISGLSITPDSLKAMANINVTGTVTGETGFEGSVFLSVFDSEKEGVHVMSNGVEKRYKLPGSAIFRGSSNMTAGQSNNLDLRFIVPRDITYGGENGRVGLYIWNSSGDGSAYLNNIPVGGTAQAVNDRLGPEIEAYFNDRLFVSGDMVPTNPVLNLKFADEQGINITGEVGHKIEMRINDDTPLVDLSRYFEYNAGSYTEGTILYRLDDLNTGENTIVVRAWDNFNNSSTLTGILNVVAGSDLIIENVLNYPNPFSGSTQFTCQISVPAEIEIRIYTVRGRLIRTMRNLSANGSSFFVSPEWDARDEDGDLIANGTYLYKLIAKSNISGETQQVEKLGKLVVMK